MTGRWPANVILSPGMANVLDEQSGITGAKPREGARTGKDAGCYGAFAGQEAARKDLGDSGGASRFFLTAGYEPWEYEWIKANGLAPCGE